MAKGRLLDLLRNAVDNVQQENRENPNQKTAPSPLFRRLQDQIASMQEVKAANQSQRWEARQERRQERNERREERRDLRDQFRDAKNDMKQNWDQSQPQNQQQQPAAEDANMFEALRKQLQQAQQDNNQRADEETAESGVWEQLMGEVQKLERRPAGPVMPQAQQPAAHNPWAASGATPISNGVIIADGSVSLRAEPNMSAARSDFRVPSGAEVNLIGEDKSNPVNLDGMVCGWCKVSVNGVEGWVPDAYLGSA